MAGGRRLDRIALATAGAVALALAGAGCDDDPAPPTSTPSTSPVAESPVEIEIAVPGELEAGRLVAAQSGCLACHRIGESGSNGPGPDLTGVGTELSRAEIASAVAEGPGIMPSYEALKEKKPQKFEGLVDFLAWLGTE